MLLRGCVRLSGTAGREKTMTVPQPRSGPRAAEWRRPGVSGSSAPIWRGPRSEVPRDGCLLLVADAVVGDSQEALSGRRRDYPVYFRPRTGSSFVHPPQLPHGSRTWHRWRPVARAAARASSWSRKREVEEPRGETKVLASADGREKAAGPRATELWRARKQAWVSPADEPRQPWEGDHERGPIAAGAASMLRASPLPLARRSEAGSPAASLR